MSTNPYLPPGSAVSDPVSSDSVSKRSTMAGIAVAIMFAIHVAIFINYFGIYFEFVRTGVLHPAGVLIGLISDALLFIGILLLLFRRRPLFLFLAAGVGLLSAGSLLWNLPFDRSLIFVTYILGAVVAFAGSWVAWARSR